ncbi:hypothetical protein EMCRGX_G001974 [Ephydatia muelleri]|eukprot:Em0001g1763a
MFRNGDDGPVEGSDEESSSSGESFEETFHASMILASGAVNQTQRLEEGQSAYDISLPARHLYLGEMEEEGHMTVAEEDTTAVLPLLCVQDRVLFPGETLPMYINNPHTIQMLRNARTTGKPVALCTILNTAAASEEELLLPQQERLLSQQELAQVGTTADVVAFREEVVAPHFYYGTCFVVKFQGRQRFRLLECFKHTNGTMEGRVAILPDEGLPPLPPELRPCPQHIYAGCMATQVMAREMECTPQVMARLEVGRKRLGAPRLSGSLCQVPAWVLNMYQLDYLRERLMAEKQMKVFASEEGAASRLPSDLPHLSYWLARRLPVNHKVKLELLQLNCPTWRLIRGLQILDSLKLLCCADCGEEIAKKEHIFSMSVDGPLASYVNPGGYVHDTLTVLEATSVERMGLPSTENSWFPGYQWTILNCKGCLTHKGWCFEATRENLRPVRFYGLTRSSLVLKS